MGLLCNHFPNGIAFFCGRVFFFTPRMTLLQYFLANSSVSRQWFLCFQRNPIWFGSVSQVTDEAKGKFRNSSRITCVWPQGSCLFQARFTFQVEVKALKKKKKKYPFVSSWDSLGKKLQHANLRNIQKEWLKWEFAVNQPLSLTHSSVLWLENRTWYTNFFFFVRWQQWIGNLAVTYWL